MWWRCCWFEKEVGLLLNLLASSCGSWQRSVPARTVTYNSNLHQNTGSRFNRAWRSQWQHFKAPVWRGRSDADDLHLSFNHPTRSTRLLKLSCRLWTQTISRMLSEMLNGSKWRMFRVSVRRGGENGSRSGAGGVLVTKGSVAAMPAVDKLCEEEDCDSRRKPECSWSYGRQRQLTLRYLRTEVSEFGN